MELVWSLVRAALTLGAVAAIILLIAALFIVVFMLGTNLDKRVNQ